MSRLDRCRTIVRLARNVASGYRTFRRSGETPREAYGAMRQLYCATNGLSNRLIAGLTGWAHPAQRESAHAGVLGEMDRNECARALTNLRREGLHVFERTLPASVIESLTAFALRTPAKPLHVAEGESLTQFAIERLPDRNFDREHPVSSRYDFEPQRIAEQAEVQQLIADPTILAVARSYLGAEPVNDLIAMWWSSAFLGGKASSAAAQLFHFDLDRVKFLKFFFYLTDVGPDNGPHCYIRGSHRSKPPALRRDGRISDEEILRYCGADAWTEVCGPAGTIIAADTSGFHKGRALVSGERLLLQFEFATDLFGAAYPKLTLNEHFSEAFRRRVREYPRLHANFLG